VGFLLCQELEIRFSDNIRTSDSEVKTEIVDINISGRIFSGSNLEIGTEHVMDVQITCYGCP
jgi:hypothetical protein